MDKVGVSVWSQSVITVAVLAALSSPAYASDDLESAQVRIRDLELQMQQITEQLKAVQAQMAHEASNNAQQEASNGVEKPTIVAKTSSAIPVEASFKNGLVLSDATGDWALRLYTNAQLDYRKFSPDKVAADTFSMRRARIGVMANFYDDFNLRIEGEYSGDGTSAKEYVKLNDGYLEFSHFKPAMIRVGQFKSMYGLERSQGAMNLNFMERAMTESVLGSVFDRGVMVHGTPLKGVYYNLSYVNGSGQNLDDANVTTDGKDWSIRAVGNIAQWAGWDNSVVHLGGFHVQGKQAASVTTPNALIPKIKTVGRGVEFFKVDDIQSDTERTLNGFESAVAYGPVKYQGEYIQANFDGANFNRDMSAWYASLQWLVTGEQYVSMYKNGVFGGIVPKNNFRYGTNSGWGALELGVRFSSFDASDFATGNANGTGKLAPSSTNEADAWTLGAKWMLNPNAQVQLNYTRTSFDTPVTISNIDHENALDMRVQFEF